MSTSRIRKYIKNQPHKPSSRKKNRTPIIVSYSKAYTLRNNCHNSEFPFEVWSIPGGRTRELVNQIEDRINKAVRRHGKIIIYLWTGTCDITEKINKFKHIRNDSYKTVDDILYEYKRAVKIVNRYKPQATIKFIDCPILSIQKWNKYKGHKKPEKYKDEDLSVTKQITYLNKKIWELNRQLGTSSVKISQFYFRTRKEPHRPARRSVQIALNNKDKKIN
jgi:hypothetical protein